MCFVGEGLPHTHSRNYSSRRLTVVQLGEVGNVNSFYKLEKK